MFGIGLVVGVAGKSSPIVFVFWGLGVVLELIAVPVAIFLLWRGDYRTRANIVITLLAAIPPSIVVLGVLVFLFGHVHM